jgi:hypothetical protein
MFVEVLFVVEAFVATKLVIVPLTAVRPVKLPFVAEKLEVKKLVAVALVDELLVAMIVLTVVVASVDVPRTVRFPDVEAFPEEYTTKLVFSTQL